MASCIDNIIGVKNPCDTEVTESLSGYFITDYPGITLQSAANIADEKTKSGYEYLKDLVRRAMLRLNNDILMYINTEFITNSIKASTWETGTFEYPYTTVAAGDANIQRGLYFRKKDLTCKLYKMFLENIRIFSAETVTTTLKIIDVGHTEYAPTINLVADEIKEFDLNIVLQGNECIISLPGNIEVYHNKPSCGIGCGGSPISDCVAVNGYMDNADLQSSEAYGIEADVLCKCDFSKLICEMANDKIIGQAAYELCGAMFYDEMTKTNRMNYLTIYKGEELANQASAGFSMYKQTLNNAFAGFERYLAKKDAGCGCIECEGASILSNV